MNYTKEKEAAEFILELQKYTREGVTLWVNDKSSSPVKAAQECLLREVYEETGFTLTGYRCRGLVVFISDRWETEYMHLFTADKFTGDKIEGNEGDLFCVPKDEIYNLRLWEGDKIFFRLLDENLKYFTIKLRYEGEKLVEKTITRY